MNNYPITIKQFGEKALIIEWPKKVEEAILEDIVQFKGHILNKTEFNNIEIVTAYNSLTIIFNKELQSFSKKKELLISYYKTGKKAVQSESKLWSIPVCYDALFSIDLEDVAKKLDATTAQIIKKHTTNVYTVYGIGFLPGFMYLGGLPKDMEVPRLKTPRLKVEAGSVGLAGKQTGIYPQVSPGGWNIIGNCPIPIFNVNNSKPCFVSVGDKISFYAISKAEYDLFKIKINVGIFDTKTMLKNA